MRWTFNVLLVCLVLTCLVAGCAGEDHSECREKLEHEKAVLAAERATCQTLEAALKKRIDELETERVQLADRLDDSQFQLFENAPEPFEEPPEPPVTGSQRPAKTSIPENEENPASVGPMKVLHAGARVVKTSSSYQTIAWKVELKNQGNYSVKFDLKVQFLDSEGYMLDYDSEYSVVFEPGEFRSLTGTKMIERGPAARMDSVRPIIEID